MLLGFSGAKVRLGTGFADGINAAAIWKRERSKFSAVADYGVSDASPLPQGARGAKSGAAQLLGAMDVRHDWLSVGSINDLYEHRKPPFDTTTAKPTTAEDALK